LFSEISSQKIRGHLISETLRQF